MIFRLVFAVLCTLALFASACGGAQKSRGGRHGTNEEYLSAIELYGNFSIEDDDLLDGLALQRSLDRAEESNVARPADPYLLSIDTERIRAAYQQLGYFEVDIKSAIEHPDKADPGKQVVQFTVKEGRRAKTILVFAGLPPEISEAAARGLVELKEGAPFDYDLYDDAKQPLVDLLQNAGYAHAELDAEVLADTTHVQATVRFTFAAGPRCTFGAVSFAGVSGQLADAIQRRIRFSEGDTFSADAVTKTQNSIYGIGRFSSVRVEPDRGAAGSNVIPVKITVVLSSKYESKLGGGVGTEPLTYEVRGRAAISAAGIPGDLWNAALDLRPAYTVDHQFGSPEPKIKALATLSRLDVYDIIRGTLELGYDYLVYEAYTSAGGHARVSFDGPVFVEWITGHLGWFIEQVSFPSVNNTLQMNDPALIHRIGLDHDERVGRYEAAISLDRRDDSLDTHHGWYLDLHGAVATKYAGSAYDYVEVRPEARLYLAPEKLTEKFGYELPAWLGKLTLAVRLRVAMIFGDVPPTERYFSGGASAQRGFSERRLSPIEYDIPYGGAGLIESGIELRRINVDKHLGLKFREAIFLDGGEVTDTVDELDTNPLKWNLAVGVGLHFEIVKSIVVRLDLGYRLNRTGPLEDLPAPTLWDKLAFHLGIGQAF